MLKKNSQMRNLKLTFCMKRNKHTPQQLDHKHETPCKCLKQHNLPKQKSKDKNNPREKNK